MRRISVLLGIAALFLAAAVVYTYGLYREHDRQRHIKAAPQIGTDLKSTAHSGWMAKKDDPQTNRPIYLLTAQSFEESTDNPSSTGLRDVTLRLYDKAGKKYTYVQSRSALYSQGTGIMKAPGAVTIVMNVPADKDAANPADVAKLVRVETSGVAYETKSGKAETPQPASFKFSQGDGSAVGASYDPNVGELHLKSAVSLDWVGKGPAENKMHIEAGDLIYREKEHKIYLSPWSKLVRRGTTIAAQNSLVTLDEDGNLQRVDSEHAAGVDVREDKRTEYSADHMTALFNDDGVMTEIQGVGNARVASTQPTSQTKVTSDRATMRFRVDTKTVNGQTEDEPDLSEVVADGHAVAESDPTPQPGIKPSESRLLRSEHISLVMMPDAKNVQEIRAPGKAQLEFKPNASDQAHRVVDASRLTVHYGSDSYIDSFQAWDAVTRTDKPASSVKPAAKAVTGGPPPALTAPAFTPPAFTPPAFTWSDVLTAKFEAGSNQVNDIEQKGHFRYEEGPRKASSDTAFLDQKANRITLVGNARVADTGSAIADKIVMSQTSGDMDAEGHVVSTHAPDPKQKPGTSMLDSTKTMQAKADRMTTRDSNTRIVYAGHALIWQGANRIAAKTIAIDRDEQTLQASGDVVSELVDSNKPDQSSPLFTIVRAPDLQYRDDTRVADYTGGVTLTHDRLAVTSKELHAYLTPKSDNPAGSASDDSSLDHALADGDVKVEEDLANGVQRKGTAEHCQYETKLSKVVLTGGKPQFRDSHKGFTQGRKLTYFSDDDKLIVEGEKGSPAYTQMKKR